MKFYFLPFEVADDAVAACAAAAAAAAVLGGVTGLPVFIPPY